MKLLSNLKSTCALTLLAAGLVACDKPGPAENIGKKIDQTVSDTGKQIGVASDKVAVKMAEQNEKAGVAINDTEITAKVKAAIFAEPGLKSLQISVDTVNGAVTLTGSVDSQASSDTASVLASAVAGVNRVENRLALQPVN